MTATGTQTLSVSTPQFVGTSIESYGSSSTLYIVPTEYPCDDDWELSNELLVEIRASADEMLAVTYLTLAEYGSGSSLQEAITDLLTSLSDYYESLLSREDKLGSRAGDDLAKLRELIRPKPRIQYGP